MKHTDIITGEEIKGPEGKWTQGIGSITVNYKDMDISELKKENGWYRSPFKQWEEDLYGESGRGKGDLVIINLKKIITEDDHSVWAEKVFFKAAELMVEGKRWPDSMQPKNACTTRLGSLYNKTKFRWLKWLNENSFFDFDFKLKTRSQYDMTRDPWVLFYAACIHFDHKGFINLRPQWYLYRSNLWALRRALLGKKNNYVMWRKFNNFVNDTFKAKKDFVTELEYWRNWSYKNK